ncbi:MAG: hypothetical protein ABEJ57_06195 [Halobacteriaceae archaeon]
MSLIGLLPGVSLRPGHALLVQFLGFETVAVLLATYYGLWSALPFATVAIAIAAIGSSLILGLRAELHTAALPPAARRLLFDSSVDVLMGLVAYIGFLTYLIVDTRGPDPTVLETVFDGPAPAPVVFFTLVVAWDLTYRIGIGWWASITGLWRTLRHDPPTAPGARRSAIRADWYTISFAAVQLLVVPFLWAHRLLAALVVGHVLAVLLVSGLSIVLKRR